MKTRTVRVLDWNQMNKKPEEKSFDAKCSLCGGGGQVYRGYLEPEVPFQNARDKRPCPRCTASPTHEVKKS